nr:hypothetical protein [Tanacetum cinerariifolium]
MYDVENYNVSSLSDSYPCLQPTTLTAGNKVLGPEETVKFMLNTQQFVYNVDMFRGILHLLMETLETLFVIPFNIETIESFMNRVGYQGVVDKDNVPLVSVYTTGDVRVRGMLILDVFLTEEIRATNDFKEYEMVFMLVDVPMNQPQPVVSTQGTHRLEPESHKENLKKVDDDDEEIEKDKDDEEIKKETKDEEIEKEVKDDGIEKYKTNEEIVKEMKTDTIEETNKSKTLPGSIAGMCKRCSLIRSHIKHKFVIPDFLMRKIRESLDHCIKVVPDVTFAKLKK